MPHSDVEPRNNKTSGQHLAVAAEALYLTNLLLLPGLAFVLLLWLFIKNRNHHDTLARCHLLQTIIASIWAGVMLVVINLLIVVLGGYTSPTTWIVVILYFTTVHATLVLLGTLGLARAMAAKHYHYPLVGRPCPGAGHD